MYLFRSLSQSFSSCPSQVNSYDYNVIIVWTKIERERNGEESKSHFRCRHIKSCDIEILYLILECLVYDSPINQWECLFLNWISFRMKTWCPVLSIKRGLSQKSFMSVNCTTKKLISLLRVYFFLTFYVKSRSWSLEVSLIFVSLKKVVKKKWEGY